MKHLLTDIKPAKKHLRLTFADAGDIFVPWTHCYATGRVNRKTAAKIENELHAQRQDISPRLFVSGKKYVLQADTHFHAELPESFSRGNYAFYARMRGFIPFFFYTFPDEIEQPMQEKKQLADAFSSLNALLLETFHPSFATRIRKQLIQNGEEGALYKKMSEQQQRAWMETERQYDGFMERCKESLALALNPKDFSLEVTLQSLPFFPSTAPTREEIMELRWAFFDIEKPLYEQGGQISFFGIQKGKDAETTVLSLYDGMGRQGIDTEEKLIAEAAALLKDTDVLCAYNIGYDAIEARNAGDFEIGLDNEEPKIKVAQQFMRRIGVKGKLVVDPFRWAKIAYGHLPNQKMATVAQHVLGSSHGKELGYAQLAELELIIQGKASPDKTMHLFDKRSIGDDRKKEAYNLIASYLKKDVKTLERMVLSDAFQEYLALALRVSSVFRLELPRVMHAPTAMREVHQRDYYLAMGTYLRSGARAREKEKEAKEELRNYFTHRLGKHPAKKGCHKDVQKAYVSIGMLVAPLFENAFPEAKLLLQEDFQEKNTAIEPGKNTLHGKHVYAQYLDALFQPAILGAVAYHMNREELLQLLKKENVDPKEFYETYRKSPIDIAAAHFDAYEKMKRLNSSRYRYEATYQAHPKAVWTRITQALDSLQVLAKEGKYFYIQGRTHRALLVEPSPAAALPQHCIPVEMIELMHLGDKVTYIERDMWHGRKAGKKGQLDFFQALAGGR